MKKADFENYGRRQRWSLLKNRLLLLGLALVLLALWGWCGSGISPEERRVMKSVRSAQSFLYNLKIQRASEFERSDDPWQTGFIGLEWSSLSTTLGALSAKRTACDPRWSVVVRRWMQSLDLQPGDRVAVYTSSSFPGMAFNVLKALESLRIEPFLIVSLGASTWGANDPLFPWPVIEKELREAGYLRTKADFYTLGGGSERGVGMPPEAITLLRTAAEGNDVPLVEKDSLEEMIQWKFDLLKERNVKALISIGGSEANMGPGNEILLLKPGLHLKGKGGSAVIGRALDAGYPVVHLLNIKALCAQTGVPFDAPPGEMFYGRRGKIALAVGFLFFAAVMALYRRWSF
ncbi:MAG: poly-gamma-glutamate system protein [Pyramidobacter sp.]